MKTIFLVTYGEYEDYSIVATFSTREKAEKWIASYNDNNFVNGFATDDYKIEPHVVDDEEIDVDKEVLLYYHFTYCPNRYIKLIGYPYYTFEKHINYISDTGVFHYWSDKQFVSKEEIIGAYMKIKEG
jgi:hypothetical protein